MEGTKSDESDARPRSDGLHQWVVPNRRRGVRGRRPGVGKDTRRRAQEPRITAIGERTGTEWWLSVLHWSVHRFFSIFFLLLSLDVKFRTWERMGMCCQTFVATSGEMLVEGPWRSVVGAVLRCVPVCHPLKKAECCLPVTILGLAPHSPGVALGRSQEISVWDVLAGLLLSQSGC